MSLQFNNLKYFVFIIVLSFVTLSGAEKKSSNIPQGLSIHKLDNGLEVILIEKPTLPMVGINTVVKVGSAYETFATSGMSHMLEHLLFNGTKTLSQRELYDSTDIIGGYNNANTSDYYTNFMMVTPAENIEAGMKLQADMLFNSILPEEKFEKEKGIVLEEIAKSLSKSSEQIERNILSVIYEGHALSLPTLGTYSTIKNMKRDEVFNFYKKHYIPNNMLISVIGNFKSSEMLNKIKHIYGKYSPNSISNDSASDLKTGFSFFEPNNTGKTFHMFHGGTRNYIQLFYELPSFENDEAYDLLKLAVDVKKEKIKNSLVKKYGDNIEGLEFEVRESPIISYLQATVSIKNPQNIKNVVLYIDSLLKKEKFKVLFETVENESIKSRTRFYQNLEKPHMFGIYNASLIAEKGLNEIISLYNGEGFFEGYEELKLFELPEDFLTIIQHAKNENASNENKGEEVKVQKFDNNGTIIITKKAHGSDLLAIHFLIKNKSFYEEKYGKNAAKVWHEAFGERMDSPEIKKITRKYGFNFTVNDNPFIPMDDIYLSPEFGYIRVEGLANDIKSSIEFLINSMKEFTPTREEYESAVSKLKRSDMMGHGNVAKKLFDSKLKEILYTKSPYAEKFPELTYESLLEFGQVYFNPSNMIVSVVSPEDNSTIYNYFKTFSTVKGIDRKPYRKQFLSIEKPSRIELNGGGEQTYLFFGFQKDILEEEKPALTVLSLILSDKIVFDIREKQGLAYRMSAGIDIINNKAMFYINMASRPENVEKLISQFPNHFSKKIIETFTQNDLKKSRNNFLSRMMFRRLSSINQAYYLGYSEYFFDDFNKDEAALNALKKVTLDKVKKAAEKYLDVKNPIELYVR